MKGLDISHWQGNINWDKISSKIDFVIIKATQGSYFVDNKLARNVSGARKAGKLVGFYHFADGGNAKKEAQHFYKYAKPQKGELIVLDWEIQHRKTVEWCLEFLQEAEKLFGFKPLIYLNQATLLRYNWNPVVKNDNGLWIAKYGWNTGRQGKRPHSFDWNFWAIWQYTSRGFVKGIKGFVDMNYTDMDIDTLKKYGKVEEKCTPEEIKRYEAKVKKYKAKYNKYKNKLEQCKS